jgi:uncharacterized membrane protein YhaH (DUF805 family)
MTWKMLWFSGRDSRVQFAIPLVLGLLGGTLRIQLIENQTAIANSTAHALFADTSRTGFSFDDFTVAQGDAVARAIDTANIVSKGFAVVLAYVLAAAAVRRLHDIHRRGWHYLLLLVPVYNIYLLCLMCFKKGESANSVHGAPPLKGAAPLRARLSLAVLLLPLLAATFAPGFVASIGMPRSVQHPNSKEKAMKAFMAVVHDGMENMRLEARVGAQDVEIWDGEQRVCVVPRPQDTPARQSATERLVGWIKARWDSISPHYS